MTDNTGLDFSNMHIQQDPSEWITAIFTTIEKLLEGNDNMKNTWNDLFNWNSTTTYKCSANNVHQSKIFTNNKILQLPMMDDNHSFDHSFDKYFKEEVIDRQCQF